MIVPFGANLAFLLYTPVNNSSGQQKSCTLLPAAMQHGRQEHGVQHTMLAEFHSIFELMMSDMNIREDQRVDSFLPNESPA